MVYRENFLFDFCHHVVQVDIPEIENRSAVEFGMEIFTADKYVQSIIGNIGGDYRLAFLSGEWWVKEFL